MATVAVLDVILMPFILIGLICVLHAMYMVCLYQIGYV